MNDTKNLAVKICIDGLKEIVLNVLAEAKEKDEHLGVAKVKNGAGIGNQFPGKAAKEFANPFTRALLLQLVDEGLVRKYGEGKGGWWEITDAGLSKLHNR